MAWSPHLTEFRAVVSISNRLSSGPKCGPEKSGQGPKKTIVSRLDSTGKNRFFGSSRAKTILIWNSLACYEIKPL